MKCYNYIGSFVLLIFLIGCSDYKIAEQEKEIKDIQNKYCELQTKVVMLEFTKERIIDLNERVFVLEINQHNEIYLDLSSKGYRRIDTSSGFFLISLDNVIRYGNGFKLLLRVGNISTATYKGFDFKIKYGKEFDKKEWGKDPSAYDKWEKSLKLKETSFTNELEPGVWNKIDVIIAPATPEELGHITLSMQTNVLSLYQRNKPKN
jgi:hypothetical protein